MSIVIAPLVIPSVPLTVAICWYLVYVAAVAWIALDTRSLGLRWWVWLLLAAIAGPIAWLLYVAMFRRSASARSTG